MGISISIGVTPAVSLIILGSLLFIFAIARFYIYFEGWVQKTTGHKPPEIRSRYGRIAIRYFVSAIGFFIIYLGAQSFFMVEKPTEIPGEETEIVSPSETSSEGETQAEVEVTARGEPSLVKPIIMFPYFDQYIIVGKKGLVRVSWEHMVSEASELIVYLGNPIHNLYFYASPYEPIQSAGEIDRFVIIYLTRINQLRWEYNHIR